MGFSHPTSSGHLGRMVVSTDQHICLPVPTPLVSVTSLWNVKSSMGFRQIVLGKAWPSIQTMAHTSGHLEQDGHMTRALGLVNRTRVEGQIRVVGLKRKACFTYKSQDVNQGEPGTGGAERGGGPGRFGAAGGKTAAGGRGRSSVPGRMGGLKEQTYRSSGKNLGPAHRRATGTVWAVYRGGLGNDPEK